MWHARSDWTPPRWVVIGAEYSGVLVLSVGGQVPPKFRLAQKWALTPSLIKLKWPHARLRAEAAAEMSWLPPVLD